MANNYVMTNEGSGENELDQFLANNDLEKIRHKLLKERITFDTQIDFGSVHRHFVLVNHFELQ